MIKGDLKKYIGDELEKMGCKNIVFSNGKPDFAAVFFDCDNLISFRKEISGWKYNGIQLNTEKEVSGKYKIEFFKEQEVKQTSY